MPRYFFPALLWRPEFEGDDLFHGSFSAHRRKWDVTIFDLYSLIAEKHPVNFAAEIASTFLNNVNLEIGVDAENNDAAIREIDILRAMLYCYDTCPTILAYYSDHSVNQYAGINSRSSKYMISQLPAELQEGITHSTSRVSLWSYELTYHCILSNDTPQTNLKGEIFVKAASAAKIWKNIEETSRNCVVARSALVKAPLIQDKSASLLHIWQGIEALFPSVQAEVTFRLSLLISQLTKQSGSRKSIYKIAKKSYAARSRAAHGHLRSPSLDEWKIAWDLLALCVQSIERRGFLPTEDNLIEELLQDAS